MSDEPLEPQVTEDADGNRYARVRIPVAVNGLGEWLAEGYFTRQKADAIYECEVCAAEMGLGNIVVHFVYALVPLPAEPQVVPGNVEQWDE